MPRYRDGENVSRLVTQASYTYPRPSGVSAGGRGSTRFQRTRRLFVRERRSTRGLTRRTQRTAKTDRWSSGNRPHLRLRDLRALSHSSARYTHYACAYCSPLIASSASRMSQTESAARPLCMKQRDAGLLLPRGSAAPTRKQRHRAALGGGGSREASATCSWRGAGSGGCRRESWFRSRAILPTGSLSTVALPRGSFRTQIERGSGPHR